MCKILCLALLLAAPIAHAGPDDAALLQQVKQLASNGQDAQTAAQVDQFVDANQDAISAILNGYINYLKQMQAAAGNDGNALAVNSASGQTAAAQNANGGAQQTSDVQASTGLQTSDVQASGDLQTAHLAGYPALPDTEPVSSVTQPTAAQIAYAAQTQKEMQARKAYLMAHPQGYTYSNQ